MKMSQTTTVQSIMLLWSVWAKISRLRLCKNEYCMSDYASKKSFFFANYVIIHMCYKWTITDKY